MRVFIVHAHHEPKSFNGAMTQEAIAALRPAGHEVIVSDLYSMGFNPVSDRRRLEPHNLVVYNYCSGFSRLLRPWESFIRHVLTVEGPRTATRV